MKFLIVFALALSTASAYRMGIANGKKALSCQFPYQVGLSLEFGPDMIGFCGGSLIGKEWVLTAAHCTDGVKYVTVYLGATKRKSAEIKHTVSSSNIIYAGFDKKAVKNDIALIRIPKTDYTPNIQPVTLPAISSSESTYAGDVILTSGWGYISDSVTEFANDLQWGKLQTIPNADCAKIYPSRITSTNFCVSTADGVSPCHGDSGGPLVLETSNVQIGVSSFGNPAGCTKGYPVAITRVTSYLDWIKEKTGISY